MIIDKNTIKDEILAIKNGNVVQGLRIGIPSIDEFYRLKLNGSLDIYAGHAGVGKTSFCLYLMTLFAQKYDLKFIIWSSENTPGSIAQKIIEYKMGKPIDTSSEDDIEQAIDWTDHHFKILKVEEVCTYKDVLTQILGIHNALPSAAAFIDPYNSLAKPKEEMKAYGSHELDYMIASEMRLFAEKHKITLMVSMHGVTESSRKVHPITHPMAGFPMPLSYSQVEGGVKWANRCSNFFVCHRYFQSKDSWNVMELHVLKVKEYVTGGRPTSLDDPIRLKMLPNNVGYEFGGVNLMHEQKTPKTVLF